MNLLSTLGKRGGIIQTLSTLYQQQPLLGGLNSVWGQLRIWNFLPGSVKAHFTDKMHLLRHSIGKTGLQGALNFGGQTLIRLHLPAWKSIGNCPWPTVLWVSRGSFVWPAALPHHDYLMTRQNSPHTQPVTQPRNLPLSTSFMPWANSRISDLPLPC